MKFISYGNDKKIVVWDWEKQKICYEIRTRTDGRTMMLVKSNNKYNGKLFEAGDDKGNIPKIRIWDLQIPMCIGVISYKRKPGNVIYSLIELKNDTFASCSRDFTVLIWSFQNLNVIYAFNNIFTDWVYGMCRFSNGNIIAACADSTLQVLRTNANPGNYQVIRKLKDGHSKLMKFVTLSDDEKYLLSFSDNWDKNGKIYLYETKNWKLIHTKEVNFECWRAGIFMNDRIFLGNYKKNEFYEFDFNLKMIRTVDLESFVSQRKKNDKSIHKPKKNLLNNFRLSTSTGPPIFRSITNAVTTTTNPFSFGIPKKKKTFVGISYFSVVPSPNKYKKEMLIGLHDGSILCYDISLGKITKSFDRHHKEIETTLFFDFQKDDFTTRMQNCSRDSIYTTVSIHTQK